ncbi:MAG: GIY-YIG nuclease family protein [Candidatus Kerfeldbacteria bacterium]|nr:GIY-YIG nuclease family protein [Candidatus Kerfeldbacteria bacterium]
MKSPFYYVYVLRSLKDKRFYIGSTNNLKKRVEDHNKGKNISTAKRIPLQLVYYEAFFSRTDALRREKYFKTSKGKTTLRLMVRDYLIVAG